jgi:hypothetical protein
MNPPMDMDMDDLDEPGQALNFDGSVRGPSSAPPVGILPQTSTMKRKTPLLSGHGASKLSSQSSEELPDRTHTIDTRSHVPPVPTMFTYSKC